MSFQRIAISLAFAAGLAVLPHSAAKAQYYYPCHPFPLFWPFCAAGAVVGTAAAIATAPFRAAAAAPYYYRPYGPYYYGSPGYYPGYAGYYPGYYGYGSAYPGSRPSGH